VARKLKKPWKTTVMFGPNPTAGYQGLLDTGYQKLLHLDYNCPPKSFLNFSGLKDTGMERYLAPNLLPKFIFNTLKIAINIKQKNQYNLKPIIIPC